tara:strand:+ start:194 stop:616 length:423 start_codon:yes stop_codon:yes gene_type:complete
MSTEIVSVIGAISGILAFAGIIYGFGVKFSRLETKVSLIWGVFVEDALRNQVKVGMLAHHSPYHRTEMSEHLGELVSPSIVSKLIKKRIVKDDTLTSAIIKEIGYSNVVEESRKLDISVQEFLALSVGTVRGIEADTNGR